MIMPSIFFTAPEPTARTFRVNTPYPPTENIFLCGGVSNEDVSMARAILLDRAWVSEMTNDFATIQSLSEVWTWRMPEDLVANLVAADDMELHLAAIVWAGAQEPSWRLRRSAQDAETLLTGMRKVALRARTIGHRMYLSLSIGGGPSY